MGSTIGFEMSLIIVEAIRGRCASFMSLPATVSEIFGGQTTPSILVIGIDFLSSLGKLGPSGENVVHSCFQLIWTLWGSLLRIRWEWLPHS